MKTDDQLMVDFTNAAISYGEALQSGTPNKVNKANADAIKAFEALRQQGKDRRVMELLEFAHPAVRLLAASLSLQFDPERSEAVLRKISGACADFCVTGFWFTAEGTVPRTGL